MIRYFEGSATKDELLELNNSLEKIENRKEFEDYEAIWNSIDILNNRKNINIDASWDNLNKKLVPASSSKIKSKNLSFLKIAAIFIIAFGIGMMTNYLFSRYDIKSIADNKTTISAPSGSRTNVILPDGTKVWLNSQSSINYKPNSFKNLREINLDGEAYFEVTKNKNIPFIVITSDINVKVHGTSFNIKAYNNDKIIETTLIEGAIEIISNKNESMQGYFLKPNHLANFNKETGQLNVTNCASELSIHTSWKDNKLVFSNEPLQDLVVKLERWYGLDIEIQNKDLSKLRFSGSFTTETAEQAIHALKLSSHFNYSIIKNKIIIY